MREWLKNHKKIVLGVCVAAILAVYVWAPVNIKPVEKPRETAVTFSNAKITTKHVPEITYDKDGRIKETVYRIGFTVPGQNGTLDALVSEGLYKAIKPDTTATVECVTSGNIRRIQSVPVKINAEEKKAQ